MYALAAFVGGAYLLHVDKNYVTGGSFEQNWFGNGLAVTLFVLTMSLLIAPLFIFGISHARARGRAHLRGSSEAPIPAPPKREREQRPATDGLRVIHRQFYDEYDGIRFWVSLPNRRKVMSVTGAPIGWLDPTPYNGWSATTADGDPLGEAASFQAAAALFKRHLSQL